jgi:hypothetical protein
MQKLARNTQFIKNEKMDIHFFKFQAHAAMSKLIESPTNPFSKVFLSPQWFFKCPITGSIPERFRHKICFRFLCFAVSRFKAGSGMITSQCTDRFEPLYPLSTTAVSIGFWRFFSPLLQ